MKLIIDYKYTVAFDFFDFAKILVLIMSDPLCVHIDFKRTIPRSKDLHIDCK